MSDMHVFKFDVDEAYAKQHNELLRNTKYLVISGISLFAISVAAGVAIWFLVDPASPWHLLGSLGLVLFGVMMLIVALVIPRGVVSPQQLYNDHPLAPAIITENAGTTITVTALVNANVDPGQKERWALASQIVRPLPQENNAVGTKVPVAAVGAQRSTHDKEHWQAITPMPIVWGTPDASVVETAQAAIPQRQWEMLNRARKNDELLQASKKGLAFI